MAGFLPSPFNSFTRVGLKRPGGVLRAPVIAYAGGVYSVVSPVAGATYQWQRDGADIAGATGTSYSHVAATDADRFISVVQTKGASVLTSNAIMTATDYTDYSTTFSVPGNPAGTQLLLGGTADNVTTGSFDSWYATYVFPTPTNKQLAPATYFEAGLWATRDTTSSTWFRNVVQKGFGLEYVYSRRKADGSVVTAIDGTVSGQRTVRIMYTDSNNYLECGIGNNNLQVRKRVAGVLAAQQLFSSNNLDGDRFWFRPVKTATNLYIQVWKNGSRVDNFGGNGYDISDLPTAASNKIAMPAQAGALVGGFTAYPFELCRELKTIALPAAGISVLSTTIVPPTSSAPIQVTVTASMFGGSGNVEAAVVDASGNMISDWSGDYAPVSGALSFTHPLPWSIRGATPTIVLRDKTDHAIVGSGPMGLVSYYAPVTTAVFGSNTTEEYRWSFSDIVRDTARRGAWLGRKSSDGTTTGNGVVPLNSEGYPTAFVPGYDQLYLRIFENTADTGRYGQWDVQVNTPCTITPLDLGNCSTSANTGTSIQLTTPETGHVSASFAFSGMTIPPEGLRVSAYLASDTTRNLPYTDQALADAASWVIPGRRGTWRDLKYSGAEDCSVTPRYRSWDTPEFNVAFCEAAGVHHWHSVPHAEDLTHTTDYFTRWAATAPSWMKMYCEGENEVWNTQYGYQVIAMAAKAAKLGHWPGVTVPSASAVTAEYKKDAAGQDAHGVSPGSGLTLRTFQPGEWFTCYSGWSSVLVEVTSASPVPIGTTVPTSGSANGFTVHGSGGILTAIENYQVQRQIEVAQIGRAILGDRFVSVLGINPNATATQLRDRLLYLNAYNYVDAVAATIYAGFTNTDYQHASNTWMTEHTSNFAAFQTNYLTKHLAGINATIDARKAQMHGMHNALRQAGLTDEQVPEWLTYEAGNHCLFSNVPSAQRAGLLAAMNNVITSAAYKANWDVHVSRAANEIGGVINWFTSVEKPFINGDIVQTFGLLRNQRGERINQHPWQAAQDYIAGL